MKEAGYKSSRANVHSLHEIGSKHLSNAYAHSLMLECTCLCAVVTTLEDDIGVIAVKAAEDPRALNKTVFIRPKPNNLSWNSVAEVWEKKIGHSLHKKYLSEAEVHNKVEVRLSIHGTSVSKFLLNP